MVLAQSALVARKLGQHPALLVDEPAADLDPERLKQFMGAILSSPAQVFLAAITAEGLPLDVPAVMFHVEHGEAKALL
jgi:recombinational DNA repair ATPase RecF